MSKYKPLEFVTKRRHISDDYITHKNFEHEALAYGVPIENVALVTDYD